MKVLSLIYLILGTLGFVGYMAHFNKWPVPFISLFVVALPYYLASITYTILIHPLACFTVLSIKVKRKEDVIVPLLHGVWSAVICAAFLVMIHNGYYLSV